jgi:hypothetical protein
LGEFATDVSRPKDHQVLGKLIEFLDGGTVQGFGKVQSWDLWDGRPGAGIDHHDRGLNRPRRTLKSVDLNCLWPYEFAGAVEQIDAGLLEGIAIASGQ